MTLLDTTDHLATIERGDPVLLAACVDLIQTACENMEHRHANGDRRTIDQIMLLALDTSAAIALTRSQLQALRNIVRNTSSIKSQMMRASFLVMLDDVAEGLGLELGWQDRDEWSQYFAAGTEVAS